MDSMITSTPPISRPGRVIATSLSPTNQPAPPINPKDPMSKIPPELAQELRVIYAQHAQRNEITALSSYVMARMSEAIGHRAGITDRLRRATYAYQQRYSPEEEAKITASDQVCVHMGIVANKVRTVSAWVKDILVNTSDKVWSIAPTPDPDLPNDVKQAIMMEVMNSVMMSGMPPAYMSENVKALIPVAMEHIRETAEAGAKSMENYIHDRLTEGGWASELSKFIDNFSAFPYAVMGGPFVTPKAQLRYKDGMAVEQVEAVLSFRNINPHNFYWSPDSTCPQSGRYVIEYGTIKATTLQDSIDLPGFLPDAIRKVLSSDFVFSSYSHQDAALDTLQRQTYTDLGASTTYPVVMYYGIVPASYLIEHKISVKDALRPVEVEVWVVGDVVVRIVENPYPLRMRPFYVTSFTTIPNSMVGLGLYDILRDVERVANSAARNLLRNMSYSSGPIGEVDESRLLDADRTLTQVTPYKIYRVTSDSYNPNNSAFKFINIPSNVQDLFSIYQQYDAEADRISGLNKLILGQVDMASSSRTASGLSMLIANAAKVIKSTIGNIDRDIIEPSITAIYNWILMYDPGFYDKVDAKVVSKGASGALQREIAQSKTFELLNLLTPYTQMGIIPPNAIITLLREIVAGAGMNPDSVIPFSDATMMMVHNALLRGASTTQTGTNSQPTTPNMLGGAGATGLPASDGRFVQSPI